MSFIWEKQLDLQQYIVRTFFCIDKYIFASGSTGILASEDTRGWLRETNDGSWGGISIYDSIVIGNTCVLCCSNNYLQISNNGVGWTNVIVGTGSNVNSHNYGITYGRGLWVFCGSSGRLYTSPDMSATSVWTLRNVKSINFYSITYGGNIFVTVGDAGTILTSTDGVTWTERISGVTSKLSTVIYANKLFIIVGEKGVILSSIDGITWIQRTSGVTINLNGVTYGGGMFVVCGNYNSSVSNILASNDGVTWIQQPTSIINVGLYCIKYINDIFICGGDNGTIFTSGSFNMQDDTMKINNKPTTPTTITHDAVNKKTKGDSITITWDSSIDLDNDEITYELSFYNGRSWMNISDVSSNNYTHTIPKISFNTTNAKYRVRAFDGKEYSDAVETTDFEICGGFDTNSSDNQSYDLGALTIAPVVTYAVDDLDEEDKLNVLIKVDDLMIDYLSEVERGKDYECNLTDIWNSLDNDQHTLSIIASDYKNSSRIRYLFTKEGVINYIPTISGYDINLGNRDYVFTQSFIVDDEDQTANLTIVEKIDDIIITTIDNAVRKQVYSIDLNSVWSNLPIGVHKIKVIVTDNNSLNSATRVYNFYKGNGKNYPPTINMLY